MFDNTAIRFEYVPKAKLDKFGPPLVEPKFGRWLSNKTTMACRNICRLDIFSIEFYLQSIDLEDNNILPGYNFFSHTCTGDYNSSSST